MFQIELAGHVFAVENKYPNVEKLCKDYFTEKEPEYTVAVSEEEIAKESEYGETWAAGYLETLAVYRKICEWLLDKDIILFHCSALEMDGKAYLFTAPSGTGKSTHTRLWREVFGDRVTMINDDKPLLTIPVNHLQDATSDVTMSGKSISGEDIRVYGTPYGGKDGIQTNTSAPVAGIVILHQAKENSIRRMDAREAYPTLLNQTYRKKEPTAMMKTLELVDRLAQLPVYSLGCTISEEAVMLAYQTLTE